MLAHSGEAPSLVARTPTEDQRAWLDLRKLGLCREEPLLRRGQGGPGMWTRKLWSLLPPSPYSPTHVWAPRQGT